LKIELYINHPAGSATITRLRGGRGRWPSWLGKLRNPRKRRKRRAGALRADCQSKLRSFRVSLKTNKNTQLNAVDLYIFYLLRHLFLFYKYNLFINDSVIFGIPYTLALKFC